MIAEVAKTVLLLGGIVLIFYAIFFTDRTSCLNGTRYMPAGDSFIALHDESGERIACQ